ncbi:MAG: PAS domain S-box protein [Chloroflexota bacterium]
MKLSNEQLATLLDNISEAIVATDKTYQIVYLNRAAEQVFGYRVEEILERPLDSLLPERFTEIHHQHLRKLRKPHTVVMIKDRPELVARRKDGTEFPVEVGISKIAQDGEEFYTAIVVDITDRKRAQAALQESEEKFHALIKHSSEAIVQVDVQGTVSYRSPAARRIFGFADQEVLGQSGFKWVHPDDLEHARQAFIRLGSEPGSTRTARFRLQRKNGGWRWIEAVGTNLLSDPAVQSIVINYRDITEHKQAEEVLRESEEKFRLIAERITEVFYLVDIRIDKTLYVSPGFEQVWGMSRSEVEKSPQNFLQAIHPDDLEHVKEGLGVMQAGLPYDLEYRIIRPDGVMRWIWDRGYPVPSANGTVDRYVGVAQDITERKTAEELLRKSEAQLSNAMKIANLGHWELDVASGMFTFTDNFYAIFRTNASEMGGYQMSVSDYARRFVPPEEGSLVGEEIRKGVETDDPNFNRYLEHRMLYADGSVGHIAVRYFIVKDDKGRTIKTYGVNQDITERKRAEEVLRASEEKFRALIEHGSEAILLIDAQGTIFFGSPAAERLLGYSPQEFLGQSGLNDVHPDDLEHVREILARLVSEPGSTQRLEYRLRHKDGTWRWIDTVATNSLHVPAVHGIVINGRNITERKQAENALLERERQLRALVMSLDDVVFEIDDQGIYRQVWTSDESRLIRPKSELLGKKLVDVWGEEMGRFLMDCVHQVLTSGIPETFEFPLDMPWGNRWFMARNSPILAPGESPHSVVALVRDITDRKQAEAKIQEQLERLTTLREVDQAIASTFDMQVSLKLLLSRTIHLLAVDAAAVLLLNPFQNGFEYKVGIGFRTAAIQNASLKLDTSLAGKVALERRTVEFRSGSNEPENQQFTDYLRGENFASYHGAPLIVKGKVIGVLEVFSRSFAERDRDWLDFFSILAGQAAILIDSAKLFKDLQVSNMELSIAYDATIEGWSRALDLRDKETEGHTRRVTELTMQLARQFGFPEGELVHVRRGALLHDIGKLGVPDHILWKAETLTESELEIIKKHPVYAYELLSPIRYLESAAIDIPYCHHEKWDGTGYPRGLKGEQIPFTARMFAVVDVWDALTSDRPYRKAWPVPEVFAYIREQAGKHFDPQVVDAFLSLMGDEKAE